MNTPVHHKLGGPTHRHILIHPDFYCTCLVSLYYLANNPQVQEKLCNEVETVVGSDKMVTHAHISKMLYLRSCVKETLRYSIANSHYVHFRERFL